MDTFDNGNRVSGPRRSRRTVALTVLGKLHEQRASSWTRHGRELNKAACPMRAGYAPLRAACNRMLTGVASAEATMEFSMSRFKPTKQAFSIIDNSRQGLKYLQEELAPMILRLDEDYINTGDHHEPLPFGPVLLTGGFHAKVILTDGDPALVYVHPSEWTKHETKANYELLAYVAWHRHGQPTERTLIVDLPKRAIHALPQSNSKLLQALEETADLYARLFLN
jgi:hypothetical protein